MLRLTPRRRGLLLLATRCALLSLLLSIIWFAWPRHELNRGPPPAPPSPPDPSDSYHPPMKTILFWNRFFTGKHFGQRVGHKFFADFGCPEERCFAADHQDGTPLPLAVEDFDFVVFHGAQLDLHDVPPARKPHQRYVFLLHESPGAYPQVLRPWDGFFNMTATYRRDSDIFMPYGWVAPRSAPHNAVPEKRPSWPDRSAANVTTPYVGNGDARRDRRLAAWMVSNCVNSPSNRDQLVRELTHFVPVDVLGACGRECYQDECDRERLAEHYDFYLALENSLCRDYVTEKLFLALQSELVPVVLGGVNYSLVAPPGSYINAADFASPRLLAEHLQALQADRQAYEQHFWWKADFEVRRSIEHVMCQMCAAAHDATLPPRVISNLHSWWHDGVCTSTSTSLGTWIARARTDPTNLVGHWFHRLFQRMSPASAVLAMLLMAVFVYLGVAFVFKRLMAGRGGWWK